MDINISLKDLDIKSLYEAQDKLSGEYKSKEQKPEPITFKDYFKNETGWELNKKQERLYEIFELKNFTLIGLNVSERVGTTTFFRYYRSYKRLMTFNDTYKSLLLSPNISRMMEFENYENMPLNHQSYLFLLGKRYDMVFFENNELSDLDSLQLQEVFNTAMSSVRSVNSDGKVVVMNPKVPRHMFQAFLNV